MGSITPATVGYGDYYPVTMVGRIIAIIMMLLGIGIFVLFVSTLAQRKLEREESRLEQRRLLGHDTKNIIKNDTKITVLDIERENRLAKVTSLYSKGLN